MLKKNNRSKVIHSKIKRVKRTKKRSLKRGSFKIKGRAKSRNRKSRNRKSRNRKSIKRKYLGGSSHPSAEQAAVEPVPAPAAAPPAAAPAVAEVEPAPAAVPELRRRLSWADGHTETITKERIKADLNGLLEKLKRSLVLPPKDRGDPWKSWETAKLEVSCDDRELSEFAFSPAEVRYAIDPHNTLYSYTGSGDRKTIYEKLGELMTYIKELPEVLWYDEQGRYVPDQQYMGLVTEQFETIKEKVDDILLLL
tara:strand:- start:507 stop:1262 length:756 start_codon:yes stop_codon:yes gene_type:complete